jgi:hypothetical protein
VLARPGRGCVLQIVYDLAAKMIVGLRFNCKICPESDSVYDLTAIDSQAFAPTPAPAPTPAIGMAGFDCVSPACFQVIEMVSAVRCPKVSGQKLLYSGALVAGVRERLFGSVQEA